MTGRLARRLTGQSVMQMGGKAVTPVRYGLRMNDRCIACGATPLSDEGLLMERDEQRFALPICNECLAVLRKVISTVPGPSRNEKYLGEAIAALRHERGLPPLQR